MATSSAIVHTSCGQNISISPLPTEERIKAQLRMCRRAFKTPAIEQPGLAKGMESLYLPRCRNRDTDVPVKGILKKTSSYGGMLVRENSGEKRVSFPTLNSSRWDSQGAMSRDLKAPQQATGMRWKSQPSVPKTNHVWQAKRREDSAPSKPCPTGTGMNTSSLNGLYLRANLCRISPIREKKKGEVTMQPIREAFQNITFVTPDML
jgi:hypothetical protein